MHTPTHAPAHDHGHGDHDEHSHGHEPAEHTGNGDGFDLPVEEAITIRSFASGFLLALLMAGINSYLTLKVGLIEEGTIITMMLFALVLWVARAKSPTSQEVALVATMGSAGGSFGFIANFFAANTLAGNHPSAMQMMLLPIMTSLLGLFMAIPLRKLYVVDEPLAWPASKATITAIESVTTKEGINQAKVLFGVAALGGLYVFLSSGLGKLPEMLYYPLPMLGIVLGFAMQPFLFAVGGLINLRVGLGFLLGALVLLIMSPFVPGGGPPHRFLWPGVMFLIASNLTTLALNGESVLLALKNLRFAGVGHDPDGVMPGSMFYKLLPFVVTGILAVLYWQFGVGLMLGALMIVLGGGVLTFVATRALGETSFNPVRIMGIMLQGVAALFGGSTPPTLLAGAGVAAGSIDQAALLTADNVFGRKFGLSARRQWLVQLAVLVPISLVAMLVYQRISTTYIVGSDSLPSPIAQSWAAMAQIFTGSTPLPPGAKTAMVIGAILGIVWALLDRKASKAEAALNHDHHASGHGGHGKHGHHAEHGHDHSYSRARKQKKTGWRLLPHSMGIGVALIIPMAYSLAIFAGVLLLGVILPGRFKLKPDTINSIAAGGILGEGLIGLVVATLKSFGLLAGEH